MKTCHAVHLSDSSDMSMIESESVQMVVTSPPYPMIEMWDDLFAAQNPEIQTHLNADNGMEAFELMHQQLDAVWDEVYRILAPGSFACINIGDATRKIHEDFMLYPNHSRILQHLVRSGFSPMPSIIWRKQTNAPNKFMGSGMLPGGAYVTLEHEYILILRKGSKREFKKQKQKEKRRESALFWEERNQWFSDIWFDLKGAVQKLSTKELRKRSAAFPFALPYRLINMYSVKEDTVVDPFLGIGTTTLAAMAAARNSIGFELEKGFMSHIAERIEKGVKTLNSETSQRVARHMDFVHARKEQKKELKHFNSNYDISVVTKQEKELCFNKIEDIEYNKEKKEFHVSHSIMAYEGGVRLSLLSLS
ncbi:MAG: site-specific DNA-methyltransferase [Thermodesulfobacteriota bacterium]|nr:site-specific DNA-methyltransferase [Thermodesulfobacteriota bacterium]